MATEARHRRMELAGFIVCLLYGIGFGLLNGGLENVLLGGGVGLLTGSVFSTMIPRVERMPRPALIGGVVVAALLVAVCVLWLRPTDLAVYLPVLILAGFQLGALLTGSSARFLVFGALIGMLLMPLIGLIAYGIGSSNRSLTMLVATTLCGALMLSIMGWALQRSLDRLWGWTILGAIFAAVLTITMPGFQLFPDPISTSSPLMSGEMLRTLKIMTGLGAMLGAMLGAKAGTNSLYPGGPKLFDGKDES